MYLNMCNYISSAHHGPTIKIPSNIDHNVIIISKEFQAVFFEILNIKAYVTGPVKTGHVGIHYTLSQSMSYLSTGTEYLHSATCIINPIKCLLRIETCTAIT